MTALLDAGQIRERAHRILDAGLAGKLDHFDIHLDAMDRCVSFVEDVIRGAYPTLDVPFHSRWRHFERAGVDLAAERLDAAALHGADRGRAMIDLAIVSVLLDAGAGDAWSYRCREDGKRYARSEGLALASLAMFLDGAFSGVSGDPLRVDASVLSALTVQTLADGFQVTPDNPLVGLESRAVLLNRLGAAVTATPEVFSAGAARPGVLFDWLASRAVDGELPAPAILDGVLRHLASVWPGARIIDGALMADAWPHPHAGGEGGNAGYVPFHKLSQWLSYSLIEPLEAGGIRVTDINGLTGLPEYRNGGLFIDMQVLQPRDPDALTRRYGVDDAFVIEWRALTVALLDDVAARLRAQLNMNEQQLPLARVLQGGTWTAGRVVAAQRRRGGGSPVLLDSDGTVF